VNGPPVQDDQIPLIEAGIPSILVADSRKPQSHNGADSVGECSAKSLQIVGQTLMNFVVPSEPTAGR